MDEIKDFLRSRTVCNLAIVAANIVVFVILELMGSTEDVEFMLEHGASYTSWIVEYKEYYRLFTSMFLHFGLEHLLYNMLVLIFLGDALERAMGKVRYLIVYLGGGMLANVVSCAMDYGSVDGAVSAGASGAIFAVVGALIYIVIINRGKVAQFTRERLILMAVLTLVEGFTSTGVDNAAHVGGLVSGVVLAVVFYRRDSRDADFSEWEV